MRRGGNVGGRPPYKKELPGTAPLVSLVSVITYPVVQDLLGEGGRGAWSGGARDICGCFAVVGLNVWEA